MSDIVTIRGFAATRPELRALPSGGSGGKFPGGKYAPLVRRGFWDMAAGAYKLVHGDSIPQAGEEYRGLNR